MWPADPPWGVGGEVSGGPVLGQVPAFLSLPLPPPLQETAGSLFPINSSSRGTPGSRDRLSPGPRWGLGLLRSASREERSLPATSMQLSRAEGPGLPLPRRPPLPPPPLSGSPGRGSKHTPPRSGPALSASSTRAAPPPGATSGTAVLEPPALRLPPWPQAGGPGAGALLHGFSRHSRPTRGGRRQGWGRERVRRSSYGGC